MKRILVLLLICMSAWILTGCGGRSSGAQKTEPVRIFMTAGQVGPELEHLQDLLERFNKENPDIIADLKDFSSVPQQQLGSINQIFLAKSPELDVIGVDVIWPGDLAQHLLPLNDRIPREIIQGFFPATVSNNTVNGQLVALPWYLDAGLLYYREDLLRKYGKSVPRTWEELTLTAREIQQKERAAGNSEFWGFLWPAGPGEGLTCTMLELISSNGGGRLVTADGKASLNNPGTLSAIRMARDWIGDITPMDALGFSGSDAPRAWWQTGNALFMRNWPYAFAMGNRDDSPIKGKFRVAPLPAGASGKGASTLGGWQLAVSKYSEHPEAALRLITFLTSYDIQFYRAQTRGYYPTIRALYTDGSLEKTDNPIFGQLLDVLDVTIARPSTETSPVYNNFSQIFFTNVHEILAGRVQPEQGIKNTEQALNALLHSSRP